MPDPIFDLVKRIKEAADTLAHCANEAIAKANAQEARISELETRLANVPSEEDIRKRIIDKLRS